MDGQGEQNHWGVIYLRRRPFKKTDPVGARLLEQANASQKGRIHGATMDLFFFPHKEIDVSNTAPTPQENRMARSFPYPWLPRPREDCIGLFCDFSDRSTLGHVIAIAAINAMSRSATSTQSLLIIRCCGSLVPEESPEVRTQLVEEIWKALENLGVPMDVSHYNALLRVYLENEHVFSPTEFLTMLERKGVEPNRVTYQRLIARYCQQGDIDGATRILEFMREKQLPVNESVFNALIMGHSQADDMESASGILNVMQQAGLEPSADTYTTLLCGYAKRGDIEAIDRILLECNTKDIYLMDKDYMDIVYTLAVNNHTQLVDSIIERFRQSAGFNHDALNLILRLVNKGQEDVGLKVLKTMTRSTKPDGQAVPSGVFFIRQMIKANRPVEKILSLCSELEAGGQNPLALSLAVESCLKLGNVELAFPLLSAMKERGHPIRQHYFWPLIVAKGKAGDVDGVLEILSKMSTEFGIAPSGETVRDYIIPHLPNKSPEEVINTLKPYVSPAASTNALVMLFLFEGDITMAAHVANRYRAYYNPVLLRRPLVLALNNTGDVASFITILRNIHDGVDRLAELSADDESTLAVPDRTEIVGQYVLEVANTVHKDRAATLQAVLTSLLEQGLGISNSAAERLQEKLGEDLTGELSTLLSKLSSGDLVPTAVSRPGGFSTGPSSPLVSFSMLPGSLGVSRGESSRGAKKQLLSLYIRNKDLENVEKVIQELDLDGFVWNGGLYAQLLDLYVHHEKLENALEVLQKLRSQEPDFPLNDYKVIRLASLLVKNDRFGEAIELLNKQPENRTLEERMFVYTSVCWRLLNTLAEAGKSEELRQIFDTLVNLKFIDVNNVMLGPLIKAHLARNDLTSALTEFEWCCHQYRATPFKNELTCKLIQAEDAAALQRLTDLSTQVHGEVNSLYDLVFAFVECGRIRQARKILETPGLRSRPQRFNSICEHYRHEGLVAPLEGLVEATRDMSYIDRSDIYYHLLLTYCKALEPEKALGLWTRMQEEDVQPSDEFLYKLGTFLTAQGLSVPFTIPAAPEKVELQATNPPSSPTSSLFTKADQNLTLREQSQIIEILLKESRLAEASKITLSMLRNNIHPITRIFNFLFVLAAAYLPVVYVLPFHCGFHAACAPLVFSLDAVTRFPNAKKKLLSFDNRLCYANFVAGRISEYLGELEEKIEQAKDEELPKLLEAFPRGGLVGILEKDPSLLPQFERLAEKYASRGITTPLNIVWMKYFIEGHNTKAEKIWSDHLAASPRLMFQSIVRHARRTNDFELINRLLDKLKLVKVSETALGVVYSCAVDVLVNLEKCDEALEILNSAVKDICLENLNRTALTRLQDGLLKQGKTFPYKIPEKNAKKDLSSSSSSSSDEDSDSKESSSRST
uniref:Leucine-rich PPR motif-containing protein, mitochondrial n=1 Tax=Timema shepardi TaxID=629360 RepID=A0A7R9FZ68_TIMSH|nr:unnamed protein product [Timema shepardi]